VPVNETVRAELVGLMERTLENLPAEAELDHGDFLARVDILGALGRTVLISKFAEYYRLATYLSRYANRMIGLVMGVPSLMEIFDEKYYLNLEGGILEALGRMFKGGLKLFVYPMIDEKTGRLVTASELDVASNLRTLFQYLIENRYIEEIADYSKVTCVHRRMSWRNCDRRCAWGEWCLRKWRGDQQQGSWLAAKSR
jgi:hypothetical protein